MARYKLACGSWPYIFPPYEAHPFSLNEVAAMLSRLKFEGIELSGFKSHAHPELYPSKSDRNELLSMLNGYGLEIAGYGADLSAFPLVLPCGDVIRGHKKVFENCLSFCADLGINTMRVDTISGPRGEPGVSNEEAWKRVIAIFKEDAEKAEDVDVTLAWEFEPGFLFNKPSEVNHLIGEVNHSSFKALVDTCHAHCCGIGFNQTPPLDIVDAPLSKIAAEFVRRLKGMIVHVHVIDSNNTLNPHNTSTHVPLGASVIDFGEVMKALKEIGYKGWLSLDLCFWPRAWEATEPCKKFLNDLVTEFSQ